MELRKKSILIALALGDGSLISQKKIVKGKEYNYVTLEVCHSHKQKEYVEWKADLCKSLTGRKCNVKSKIVKERTINGNITPELLAYRFTCTHKYYKIIKKWLYKGKSKIINSNILKYLDPQGIAIWYMDDGSTYINKNREKTFSCEISTHIPESDALDVINYFKSKWDIQFHLHKKAENQYNVRCYSAEAFKFIKLISPFVPQCMDYKLKIPKYYSHEHTESFKD